MIPALITLILILPAAAWGIYDVIVNPADYYEPMPKEA